MSTVKLYKCTTGTCNKCTDTQDPYLTEQEYNDLSLDLDGKIQCPENNFECGIRELTPEEYPKPPRDNKIFFVIAGCIVASLLVIGSIYFFVSKKNTEIPTKKSSSETTEIATDTTVVKVTQVVVGVKDTPSVVVVVPPLSTPSPVGTGIVKPPKPAPSKGPQNKTFSGGSKYVGDMIKGQMHGLGTYTYGQRELISTRDSKNRYAEAGDYIVGQFECSKVVSGKLFDKNNNLKEVIIIGGTGCTP
jgi:hypothetical protein